MARNLTDRLEDAAANPLSLIGESFRPIGRWAFLLKEAFSSPRQYPKYRYNLFRQMVEIGLNSLPIVMLAAAFTGAVTTVQADYQMDSPFAPESGIGMIVTASVVMELGVLITAFILCGRVGARIAAELASMRVGEQIDAIEVMGLNAAGYLIAPRIVAGALTLPILYAAACVVAITSAILLSSSSDVVSTQVFLKGARTYFNAYDIFYGIVKASVFGFLITSISCYKGFYASGGAEGIGQSATHAAVLSCIYVLFADYILAEILL
jgi:phospholipid/cholesterol/gamma-HCH transport system permease protein